MKESPRRKGPQRQRRTPTRRYNTKGAVFTYKDAAATLTPFLTEQGSIVPRSESGLSQKQQRSLTIQVKRARHLALLPFTQTL